MDNGTSIAKVDLAALQKLAEEKLINIQKHEKFPLLIFNYTPVCQYGKNWTDLTRMCRGLITDMAGNIVSRPFPKFFNIEEHFGADCNLPPLPWDQPFASTEKMDGSLGILYPTPEGFRIATRGSFSSDQAIRATEIFYAKGYDRFPFSPNHTYLFEIIFPQNRIVVDYGPMEDLILLEVIHTSSGKSLQYLETVDVAKQIGCPMVNYLALSAENIQRLEEYYGDTNGSKEEGLVVRFADGTRAKVKYAEYKRLHRLVTGCSKRSIWENLKEGKDLADLLERVPDEFNSWVRATVRSLQDDYDGIEQKCKDILSELQKKILFGTQKDYALEIVKWKGLSGILFCMLGKKDYKNHIWKIIKPASTKPFHQDIDA